MPSTTAAQLQVLLSLWPDLPSLCAAAWPDIQRRLDALAAGLLSTTDEQDAHTELQTIFAAYPVVLARLQTARLDEPTPPEPARIKGPRTRGMSTRSGTRSPTDVRTRSMSPLTRLSNLLQQRLRPRTVQRFADIGCPDRVWITTRRIQVVVKLLAHLPSHEPPAVQLAVQEGESVSVRLDAPGFTLLSDPVQDTEIRPDADSPPIVFDLEPKDVGHHLLEVSFVQFGNLLGTATLWIECTGHEVATQPKSAQAELRSEQGAAGPDLVLWVTTEGDSELCFTLVQDSGASWRSFPSKRLTADPATFATRLFRDMTGLTLRSDPITKAHRLPNRGMQLSAAEVDVRIKELGQNLWDKLIPDDLKTLYHEKKGEWLGRSLLILSDEPNLPWELVWPYGRGWSDEVPWCCTFRLTRWLRRSDRGNPGPPTLLPMKSLAVLAPDDADLPSAQEEKQRICEVAKQHGISDRSPAEATLQAARALLQGGAYDWLHIAAHGKYHAESPESLAGLLLQDGMMLTPNNIVGPEIEDHIATARPAFIFNACEVGQQGWGLTGVAGWATTLLRAGAGLFAGSLWEITDDGALAFMMDLYGRLLKGVVVGEAFRQARMAARAKGDPTWLAYTLYAHPNARVVTDGS